MLALSLSGLALVAPGETGLGPLAAAIAEAAPTSLKSLLHQRSPGRRVKGELAQTKARKQAVRAPQRRASARPSQRALPKVALPALPETFVRPLFGDEKPWIALAAPPVIPDLLFETPAPLLASREPIVQFAGFPFGSPGGPGGGTTPPIVSTPAIPEPETWALMLLGFGAAGVALRRRAKPKAVPAR